MRIMGCICVVLASFVPVGAEDGVKPKDDRLGLKPSADAVVLFDGADLSKWAPKADPGAPAEWPVKDGILTVGTGKGDIQTKEKFGNYQLHIEFNVPYMPKSTGQGRGNSGVYQAGIYELQVLDSYGLKLQSNDCGAIYTQIVPSVNVCKPPLQWQTYDVVFTKAVKEGDKVVKKARITVEQNGVKTIDDKEISPTPGGAGNAEGEDGPILLQDHGNDVQYRNIWLVPVK